MPAIPWRIPALLWAQPFPVRTAVDPAPINWAVVGVALATLDYRRLSPAITLGITAFNFALLALCAWLDPILPLARWQCALTLFVVAWIGPFIGHNIDRRKPSKDIQFLPIGPAWLLGHVDRSLRWHY